jgi:SNF2 family DNA or RNA helicase
MKYSLTLNTEPLPHQIKALQSRKESGLNWYAYLMDQGTGKSLVAIMDIVDLVREDKLDGVMILCPKTLVNNWIRRQIHEHLSGDYECGSFQSRMTHNQSMRLKHFVANPKGLPIIVTNYEVLRTEEGFTFAKHFLNKYKRNIIICDESTYIKNHKAALTKRVQVLRNYSTYRRILTGTPMPHRPLDIFSQTEFLNRGLLGFYNYKAFLYTYAITIQLQNNAGRTYDKIVDFVNLKDLSQRLGAFSFRVKKEECLSLPGREVKTYYATASLTQQKLYTNLADYYIANLEEEASSVVSVSTVGSLITKLQQILCGFVIDDEGQVQRITPCWRTVALLDIFETEDFNKAIIWCRFREDIAIVGEFLEKKYGPESFVSYYGSTTPTEREKAVDAFETPNNGLRFFVATSAASRIRRTDSSMRLSSIQPR